MFPGGTRRAAPRRRGAHAAPGARRPAARRRRRGARRGAARRPRTRRRRRRPTRPARRPRSCSGVEIEITPAGQVDQAAVAAVRRREVDDRARVPVRGVPRAAVPLLHPRRGRGGARRPQPRPLPGAAAPLRRPRPVHRGHPPEAHDGGRRLALRRLDGRRRRLEGALAPPAGSGADAGPWPRVAERARARPPGRSGRAALLSSRAPVARDWSDLFIDRRAALAARGAGARTPSRAGDAASSAGCARAWPRRAQALGARDPGDAVRRRSTSTPGSASRRR